MAARLEILGQEATNLAEQFRRNGQQHFADMLSADGTRYTAQALVARKLGVPESFPVPSLQPVNFEIPTVSEEVYTQAREALAKEGFTFVVGIEPISVGQLATDRVTGRRFSYVNPSEGMRAIVPQQMEVAINPRNLRVRNSNRKSTDTQIRMIQEEEARLRGKLPEDVRDLISMRIQHASVLAQLDARYKEETGNVVFTDWFGRTDDQTSPGRVAFVGRIDPSIGLDVDGWSRAGGSDSVFGVPVVVLPRKS